MDNTLNTAGAMGTTRLPGAIHQIVRGRVEDPAWVRPALLGLLAATAVLYFWNLSVSGWANAYYSMAAQAGSLSWKAFFFGTLDAASAITVDKTPASVWLMALSVRLFGLSSWSILLPQALAGVATTGLVYLSVRRALSPAAGLIAAGVSALTPVAVLMFRYNNPDALLVLLMVAAAYALLRAQEEAETRWLVLAGVLLGFGFLAKMLQVVLVLPAFALVYLLTAPTSIWRRLRQGVLALLAMLLAGGWWVAIVELWPAASRPYIGGSQTNSVIELMFGYNGLGRVNGEEAGSVVMGGGPGGPGAWGEAGLSRMFGAEVGTQVSWLLPAALLFLLAGLWWTSRASRTDGTRAAILLWGGWLLGSGLVFSLMQGIFHAYYTVALAPAIGALVGLGAVQTWKRRYSLQGRVILSGAVMGTAVWSWVLLSRTPEWQTGLRNAVLILGLGAGLAILILPRLPRRLVPALVVLALVVSLAGPGAYAVQTVLTPHAGGIPTAGPQGALMGQFAQGGLVPPGLPANPGDDGALGRPGFLAPPNDGRLPNQLPGFPGGRPAFPGDGAPAALRGDIGGPGGLLQASEPGQALIELLQEEAERYTWTAAVVGANSAAGYQLAAGEAVLSIGGFNGSDPWPTLETFQELVNRGEIHYFITGGRGFGDGRGTGAEIEAWVGDSFPILTVDGVTLYDLSRAAE